MWRVFARWRVLPFTMRLKWNSRGRGFRRRSPPMVRSGRADRRIVPSWCSVKGTVRRVDVGPPRQGDRAGGLKDHRIVPAIGSTDATNQYVVRIAGAI